MIDQELPVLRKEDLITILEALFRLSQKENNAFVRESDGLYVLDFHQAFEDHINDTQVHATSEETAILHNFSIVDDVLHYKNKPIVLNVSEVVNNAVQVLPDGLYVPNLSNTLDTHIADTDKHITTEERQTWNNILSLAKKYADDLVDALVIYDYQIVSELPVEESVIKATTVYCLEEQLPDSSEKYCVRYIYREHTWIPLDITKESYKLFARKQYVDETFVRTDADTVHKHNNLSTLNKFSENNIGRLLFNGLDILDTMQISDDADNAIFRGSDDKLYVKDLSSELESIARQASLSKVILLNQECDSSGLYELEEDIDNFNFLMIHYYLKPDDENLDPYDAKMEMVDVDALKDLYTRRIDYILEHDYGISTFNTKIRFPESNKMQITYYNHVCIYKIIGVR